MADDLKDTIKQNAEGPAEARGDGRGRPGPDLSRVRLSSFPGGPHAAGAGGEDPTPPRVSALRPAAEHGRA